MLQFRLKPVYSDIALRHPQAGYVGGFFRRNGVDPGSGLPPPPVVVAAFCFDVDFDPNNFLGADFAPSVSVLDGFLIGLGALTNLAAA